MALLRRGFLRGEDVSEFVEHFEGATGSVGLWLSVGSPVHDAGEVVRDIDSEWPVAYRPYHHLDPSMAYLDENGPFAVHSAVIHAPAWVWKHPLGIAFRRAGWVDCAAMRTFGDSATVMAAYRPRGLTPFAPEVLERMSALLPLLDLALAPRTAIDAIRAPRDEPYDAALDRIRAYAILDPEDGDAVFSAGAQRLLKRVFGELGAHGERRVTRALRAAFVEYRRRNGPRVVALRHELAAELALLPRAGKEAAIFVSFVHREPREETRVFEELLSPTQRRVARRLADGATIPIVARELAVSGDAVKMHLREIYRRLGVESRAELAALYAG